MFWPVPFAFVKAWDVFWINFVRRFYIIQNALHAVVEFFGPKDIVVLATVRDERRDMPRHGRPVNVGIHRFAKPNGVACE